MGSHRAPRRAGRTWVRRILTTAAVIAGALAVLPPSPHPAPAPAPAAAATADEPVVLRTTVPAGVAAPTRVHVPSLGVDSSLALLDVDGSGVLTPPSDFDQAGWFTGGPAPGDVGPAVIAGHVDSRTGPAVFFRLHEIAVGDEVLVDRADGTTVRFAVTRVDRYAKDAFPTDEVYGPTPGAELRLITCGGEFDRARRSYLDNVVVYASMAGMPGGRPSGGSPGPASRRCASAAGRSAAESVSHGSRSLSRA